MNPASNSNLPDDLLRRIDQTCDEFETAWKGGSRPCIDDFLDDFPESAQIELLKELLTIEIARRKTSGETPSIESYVFRFPQLEEGFLESLLSTSADDDEQTRAMNGFSPATGEAPTSGSRFQSSHITTVTIDDLPTETAGLVRDFDMVGIVDARACLAAVTASQRPPERISEGELVAALTEQGLLSQWQAERLSASQPDSLVLGDYVLIEPIGKGGMGVVYRARHRRMDRLVALKTLTHQTSENDDSIQRFQREVRAAARLSHPNIVAAYDAGEHRDIHYLVMELVDGIDLSRLVRQSGPLNPGTAIDYICQAATGFAYAHSQGIIHRDIKPQNLLVDRKQQIKILDMGLARLHPTDHASLPMAPEAQTELTQSGVIMGTVDFMSPEQATNTRHANEQSDIYSLGCTLYFLMTGRAMFEGETCMERLLAHHQESRPSLVTMVSRIPPALDRVFTRMTARLPADRYRSMDEVVEALDQLKSEFDLPASDSKNPNHEPGRSTPVESATSSTDSRDHQPDQDESGTASGVGSAAITRLDDSESFRVQIDKASPDTDRGLHHNQTLRAAIAVLAIGLVFWLSWRETGNVHENESSAVTPDSRPGSDISMGLTLLPDRLQPDCDWPEASSAQQQQRRVADEFEITPFVENSLGMVLAVVPAGDQESAPFLMSTTEVTVRQFGQFVDETGYELRSSSRWGYDAEQGWVRGDGYNFRSLGDLAVSLEYPACSISWLDAQAFCDWLSQRENATYRLPTVTEWRTANAAGTSSRWFFGDDSRRLSEFAWYDANSGQVFHEVAQKRPNALGLYDTLGNEYEWCADTMSEPQTQTLQPQIGGGFGDSLNEIARRIHEPALAAPDQGQHGAFRIVREL